MKDSNKGGQSQINVVYFINHITEQKKQNKWFIIYAQVNKCVHTFFLDDILKNKKKI